MSNKYKIEYTDKNLDLRKFCFCVIDGYKRKENIKNLENALGLKLERWPGIFTRSCPGKWNKTKKQSERGVTLAHILLWNNLLKRQDKEYMVIFEDDAIPSLEINFKNNFMQAISNLEADITRLGYCKYSKEFLCSHAYVINKKCVRKLLDNIDDCSIVDNQISNLERKGIISVKNIDPKYYEGQKNHWTSGLFHQLDNTMQTNQIDRIGKLNKKSWIDILVENLKKKKILN